MPITDSSVVYTDPTREHDVLIADPPDGDSDNQGSIGVVPAAQFHNGYAYEGRAQRIHIRPGDELRVLADIGNRLRGVSAVDSNRAIVTTVNDLERLGLALSSHYEDSDTAKAAVSDLIDLLQGQPLQPYN